MQLICTIGRQNPGGMDISPPAPLAIAASLPRRHWVNRVPATDSSPDHLKWQEIEPQEINALPRGRPAFEGRIPKPPCGHLLRLENDGWLGSLLQEPKTGLAWYHAQLNRRAAMKAEKKEYTLSALRPTLENMRLFIAHLQAGRQFSEPLTDAERGALNKLDKQAAALLQGGEVPYRRTVFLAFAFGTLYELLAQKHVLARLVQQNPVMQDLISYEFGRCETLGNHRSLDTVDIDPERVVACDWGGLNPGGEDEKDYLFDGDFFVGEQLPALLDNEDLLLYPSWQPLDLKDLCHLGHLPVYPVGLISTYATNADGFMHSPFAFMVHDLAHALQGGTFQQLHGSHPLDKPESRVAFRQLILNKIPRALAHLELEKALTVLVFYLLHEEPVKKAIRALEERSFTRLMLAQLQARRDFWTSYSDDYQGITDEQGAIAALWIHRLFAHWKAASYQLSTQQLDGFAQRFLEQDRVQLLSHLDYIEQQRDALRDLFFSQSEELSNLLVNLPSDNRRFTYMKGIFLRPHSDCFFQLAEPRSGCCIDNCEVVYFDKLHQAGGREEMERITGSPVLHTEPL